MLLAIIEDMKPHLRAKEYGEAVRVAVVELTELVHGEQVVHSQNVRLGSKQERSFKILWTIVLGSFYVATLSVVFFIRKDQWGEERTVTNKLKRIENDCAHAL